MGETTARARPILTDPVDVIARPRTALLRSTALSIALSAVPLAVALVWVSFPARMWAIFATFVVVLALLTAVTFFRLRTAFIGVGASHLHFRGVVGRRSMIERTAIERVVTATTFTNSVDRLTREFIALDASGMPLLRLRGVLWDEDAFGRVITALGTQVTEYGTPVALKQFLQEFPDRRPWFERHSGAVIMVVATGVIVAVVLAAEVTGVLAH